ncbi:MAG: right-handed parallel beta-helix repeat-containing protein [Acidimicrobiales bacterium]
MPLRARVVRTAAALAASSLLGAFLGGAGAPPAGAEPATGSSTPSASTSSSSPTTTTPATTTPTGTSASTTGGTPIGTVVTVPLTIAANCSVDVTSKLTSWIASVPDGSTLRLLPGGCYRIEGTVLVKDRNGLTIDGNGATLRAFTVGSGTWGQVQTRNHLRFWGGRDLTVRNLVIRGVNADHRYHREYAGHHAFALVGVTNALIENNTVSEVYGDFVMVQSNLYRDWRWSDGVVVRNNNFSYSGRQGFSVVGGRNVTFSGNQVNSTGITAVDIEPDGLTGYDAHGFPTGSGAANVKVVDNRFSGKFGGIFFSAGGYAGKVDGVEVSRNILDGVPFFAWVTGTAEVPRSGFTFTGNVSNTPTGGPRSAFELTYVNGAVVTGNTIPNFVRTYAKLPPDKVAMRLWGATAVQAVHNDFTGAASVLLADVNWDGTPWTGRKSTWAQCGNRYWWPDPRVDVTC